MRSHVSPEIIRARLSTEQLLTLGRVDESDVRHKDQCGPGLSEKARGLLRHGYARVGQFPKVRGINARRVFRISNRCVGHSRGGDTSESRRGLSTLGFDLFDTGLDLFDLVRNI